MAQYDEESIIVYQAYRPSIAKFAVENQRFGGEFSFTRMSWIKPNFLWMMHRSGWASKEGQERVLAVRIRREGFEAILADAVLSTFNPRAYHSPEEWKRAGAKSDVRLQWDPDHAPSGAPLERRAVQLGLRGETLRHYASDWIVEVLDITDFVHQQAAIVRTGDLDQLLTPAERIYSPQEI